MKVELIEGSETSAIRTQTPGNYPKENILHGKDLQGNSSGLVELSSYPRLICQDSWQRCERGISRMQVSGVTHTTTHSMIMHATCTINKEVKRINQVIVQSHVLLIDCVCLFQVSNCVCSVCWSLYLYTHFGELVYFFSTSLY